MKTRSTGMPRPAATRGSSTAARSRAPKRVRASSSCSSSASTTQTTTMKSRYAPMPSDHAPLPNSKRWRKNSGSCTIFCSEPMPQSTAATAMKTRPIENSTWSRWGLLYIGRYSSRSRPAPASAVSTKAAGRQARKGQPAFCISSTRM